MINLPEIVPIKSHSNSITLIGEILIDEIVNSTTNQTTVIVGGSPANITCNLHDLGITNIKFFGAIGNDFYGQTLATNFKRKQIDLSYINRTTVPTSVVKLNKTEGSPIPEFHRGADSNIVFTEELRESVQDSSILHFSYWPLSTEPSKSTVLKAIEIARNSDTLIGFDPNYHPDLQKDDGLSPQDLLTLLPYIDIIKPSLDDSKRIFGEGFTIEEYFHKFINSGIQLVVMTLGANGVIAHYKGRYYQQPSLATNLVDATGAGDAFLSGLYSGILHGETIPTILQLGSACSAENLKHLGAISYLPPLDELKKKYSIGE